MICAGGGLSVALDGVNDSIRRANQRIQNVRGMSSINFVDAGDTINGLINDLSMIVDYVTLLPGELDSLDHPLFVGFANGPAEALSNIKSDDIKTNNTPGVVGSETIIDGDEAVTVSVLLNTISFDDFTG